MDFLQLEHFLAVAEERTFTRAAERVGRTQSAISQSIRRLEEELGTRLFARDGHNVSLTDAGRTLMESARKMMESRADAVRQLGAFKDLTGGALKIAAHESAAVYLLPAPLRAYVSRFPDIKVGIYRSPLADIPHMVMDRAVHVGFVKDEPPFHELKSVEVHGDEMVLVAPRRHPLARRAGVTLRDLGNERFVVHHLCSTTEEKILRLFECHQTPCRIVAELWSFENIKTFVLAEVGLAIVPRITVDEELREGRLVQIHIPELQIPRRTLMIYRDHGYLSEPARQLIALVRGFNWGSRVARQLRVRGA
jgi:DNA-binding transcriptional LysR family regulator